MNYKPFQSLSLSTLGLGNMRLPTVGNVPGAPIDRDQAQALVDAAIAGGINYFDTAYVYHGGESESFLGESLTRYPRDSFHLATKYISTAGPDYRAIFEEQLRRLKTDYVDFYLIHAVLDGNARAYEESGCIPFFEEQKRLGRIRHLGFSSHASPDVLAHFAGLTDFEFAQIQFNCFDVCYGHALQEYRVLDERGIPVIVMEPVRGGRLASLSPAAEKILRAVHPSWTPAEWAFRFIMRYPRVQVILSGMSDMAQMTQNLKTFGTGAPLSDTDEQTLVQALDAFRHEVQVPCTGCRYCCDSCPASINIPAVLDVYNRSKIDGAYALHDLKSVRTTGFPADCISCGACLAHCPQHIAVPDIMREITAQTK